MHKLFHVFISSTYSDLQEERQRVSEAISKAGHVPEGMEIFPASSQKQLDFIKRVIDRCDYYVVVLAGRYGSTTVDGVSFTELEFEYARTKKIPTLAFLHSGPDKLEPAKTEEDELKRRRLAAFRQKLERESLVDYWNAPDQLATKVVAALAQEVSSNPGVGWIRGNQAATNEVLNEINNLRKENDELREALKKTKPFVSVENLAGMDQEFILHYVYKSTYQSPKRDGTISLTWANILKVVGPAFRTAHNAAAVELALTRYFKEILGRSYYEIDFSMTDKETILSQMELLGFMKAEIYGLQNGGQGLFHTLTPAGLAEVLKLNAVRVS